MGLQDFQDDLAFQFAGGLLGQLLQRDGPIEIDVGIEILLLASYQVAADNFFVAQDHVTFDQVFQLADVTWPMVLLQR